MRKILITILIILTFVAPVEAASDALPEVMVGQTKVTTNPSTNQSVKFNGPQYVTIPNPFSSGFTDFTLMFWLKPTRHQASNLEDWQSIIEYGKRGDDYSSTKGFGVAIHSLSNKPDTFNLVASFANGTAGTYTNSIVLNTDQWTHIALTKEGSTIKVYKDQETTASWQNGTAISGSPYNGSSLTVGYDASIGNGVTDLSNVYSSVDELRVYNKALKNSTSTGQQIIDRAKADLDGYPVAGDTGLIGAWFFDGNYNDATSYGHNGYVYNPIPQFVLNSHFELASKTYYGGLSGNEAVYNYTNENAESNRGEGQSMGQKLAPSLKFDGVDDYVDFGNSSAITGTGPFSISVWVKLSSTGMILNQRDADHADTKHYGEYWLSGYDDGKVNFEVFSNYTNAGVYTSTTHDWYIRTDPGAISKDKWSNVTIVRKSNGTDNRRYEIWVNGTLNKTLDDPSGEIFLNNTAVPGVAPLKTYAGLDYKDFVRNGGDSTRDGYVGSIDDLRIYSTAITSTEVNQIYKSTNPKSTNLISYFGFNEGSGATAHDNSGNNHDAALSSNFNWNSSSGWDLVDGPVAVDPAEYNNDGYDLFGFEKDTLSMCLGGIILQKSPYWCYITNSKNSNINVMTSRTYIGTNTEASTETATLLYPSKALVDGDVYLGGTTDPNNFAYWGRNLTESHSSATANDAFWGINNYSIGPLAQSNWTGSEHQRYLNRINLLKGESTSLTFPTASTTLYMQGSSITDGTQADKTKYPDGKIWVVDGSLTINSGTYNFDGKGTVIVNGNLTIQDNTKIQPLSSTDQSDQLGFIVLGGVTLGANSLVQAAMFGTGTLTEAASNTKLIGAYIFNSFGISGSNIGLYYDRKLDSSWPPGFKYLSDTNAASDLK